MADTDALADEIRKLLTWCDRNPVRRRKHEFRGGLSVTIYIDQAGRRHVMLARVGDVGPSDQEARTVVSHWPEPVPGDIHWTPAHLGRFLILISIWKMPEQLKLGAEEPKRDEG